MRSSCMITVGGEPESDTVAKAARRLSTAASHKRPQPSTRSETPRGAGPNHHHHNHELAGTQEGNLVAGKG